MHRHFQRAAPNPAYRRFAARGRFRHAATWLVAVAGALPIAAGAVDRPKPAPFAEAPTVEAAQSIRSAIDAMRRDDCKTAMQITAPLVDVDPSPLPPELRVSAYHIMAACKAQDKAFDDAYRYAVAGTAIDGASDALWQLRLAVALDGKQFDHAVTTVEAMARERAAALNTTPVRWLYDIDNQLGKAKLHALRARLLAVLTGGGYAPVDPMANIDSFRHRRAELLLDAGDRTGAARLIGEVRNPGDLLEIDLDPRLRAMLPPDFNLRRSVEEELARMQSLAAQHPDLIAPVVRAAGYLRALGRPQQALQALEPLRPRIGHKDAFSDADDQTSWWWDMLSRSYRSLARYDETIAAMRSGADERESGGANVSQVINLAENQLGNDHAREALDTLTLFEKSKRSVSGYGMMQVVVLRGCARARLGKPSDAADDLAYLRAHASDAPDTVTDLLLCTGDLDGAAASFVHRLDDPELRVDALKRLSDYDAPPVPLPINPFDVNLPAAKARGDVKAAIARAGGVPRIPLQNVEF